MRHQTDHFNFYLDEKTGHFSINSVDYPWVFLHSWFQVSCKVKGESVELINPISGLQLKTDAISNQRDTPGINPVFYAFHPIIDHIEILLRISFSLDGDMAYLNVEINNESKEPISIEKVTFLDIKPGELKFNPSPNPQPVFFSNGWQSWSATSTYNLGEKQQISHLGPFQNPMVVNPGTPKPTQPDHFSGDMFGVVGDRQTQIGLIAGFLSQKQHFGSLEARFHPEPEFKVWANGDGATIPPGEKMVTDWMALGFINLDHPKSMDPYLKAVANAHHITSHKHTPVGWCSWYQFYQDITEEIIQSNLDAVVKLKNDIPLPLFQIDDGFEPYPGDWDQFVPGFPNGLEPIAAKVKAAGQTPGIWLAPYIVHPKSELAKKHPDWLLRDQRGKPVNAGFVWNAFNYALDLTHPEACAYTCDLIRTAIHTWGFDYLKLDFLYAAALEGVYQDPTQTRAQVLRKGLESLREVAGPEVTMLACGCPLGSALDLFEAMRIGPDVSGTWQPHFPPVSPFLKKEPHMPSARNAIRNSLTRANLHRQWWINDPDCLLVRPDTALSLDEIQTLATVIGMTGGSLLLSDDLPALPRERLRIAQSLVPVIDQPLQVLDWFESQNPSHLKLDLNGPEGPWHVLAFINWDEKTTSFSFSPKVFNLDPSQVWWLREFWTGAIGKMSADSPLTFKEIPAHGVRVIAVRPFKPEKPAYLGSDLHFTQGREISAWDDQNKHLKVGFDLGRNASGDLFFYLPWKSVNLQYDRGPSEVIKLDDQIYKLRLENCDGQVINIQG